MYFVFVAYIFINLLSFCARACAGLASSLKQWVTGLSFHTRHYHHIGIMRATISHSDVRTQTDDHSHLGSYSVQSNSSVLVSHNFSTVFDYLLPHKRKIRFVRRLIEKRTFV